RNAAYTGISALHMPKYSLLTWRIGVSRLRLSDRNTPKFSGRTEIISGRRGGRPMRLRRLLLTGTVGAAALLAIGTAAGAAQDSGAAASHVASANSSNAPDSLRSLAAQVGLRIGTAIIP